MTKIKTKIKTAKETSFNRKNVMTTLIFQTAIMISTCVTAIPGILYGSASSEPEEHLIGFGYFRMFTMDSNVLTGLCSLVIVFCAVRSLMKKEDSIPLWGVFFQFVTTSCLLLTIVIVTLFLAPMDALSGRSYFGMFSRDLFIFHLTNPLLAVGSFLLQNKHRFTRKECLWGVLPLAVYAVVYFLMVVVFRKWNDFYGFSFGGRNYLILPVVIAIFSLSYWLTRLLTCMNVRVSFRE